MAPNVSYLRVEQTEWQGTKSKVIRVSVALQQLLAPHSEKMDSTKKVMVIVFICISSAVQIQAQDECNLRGLCQGELLYTTDTDSHSNCQVCGLQIEDLK